MNEEKRLRRIFSALPESDRHSLLAFAEFLQTRAPRASQAQEPLVIPRPAEESVIGAIKRLSATYPMLDKSAIFNETSHLVSQHVLHGREAGQVIDDLEALFERAYQAFKQG
jgi:hypothetical protein